MKELKQFIAESLLDNEEDFIDPIEDLVGTDIKIIKDSLTTSNFKKAGVGSSPRYITGWYMKKSSMIKLNSGVLFHLADFEDLPQVNDGDYRILIEFAKDEKEMESVIILGIEYVNTIGKSILLKKIINLDYKEYQTPGKFVKYLNNVLFKDKQSIVNILKDIKETGRMVNFF